MHQEKLKSIKPVTGVLKKGQTIVREGDTITNEILSRINVLNRHAQTSHINFIIGVILLQVIFVAIMSFFTFTYEIFYFPDRKGIVVVFSLLLFFMLSSLFVDNFEIARSSKIAVILLMPIPFVTMMISILYNIYLSLFVALYLVFFTFMTVVSPFGVPFLAGSSRGVVSETRSVKEDTLWTVPHATPAWYAMPSR